MATNVPVMSHGGTTLCACASSSFGSCSSTTGFIALATKSEFDTTGIAPDELIRTKPKSTPRRGTGAAGATKLRAVAAGSPASRAASRIACGRLKRSNAAAFGCEQRVDESARAQAPADQGELRRRARPDRRRKHCVKLRPVVNRQAIDVVGRAGEGGVVHLDDVSAVSRQGHVEERVEPEDVTTLGELGSRRRQDAERRVQPAVDPLGLQIKKQPLTFLALERETVDVGSAVDLAVDHRVDDDRPGLLRRVVRLNLDRLRPVSHHDRPRVAHAVGSDRPQVVMPQRHIRPGRDPEGQVLDVDRTKSGMIEPEPACPFQVGSRAA